MVRKPDEPWEKPAPKKSRTTKLTPQSKAKAKAAATRAGRKYPNLVDNMNAAKQQQ
jgi:ribosomal protein L15E